MKKILDSKFLFILALSLIVLLVLGIGAFYLSQDKDTSFVKSGYVLNPLSAKSEKYFFDENTGYKENLSKMIVFKDVDDKEATVLKESFLHYNDGSLSFLTNGAILDLDSIHGTKAVDFYNITNKSIIEKKSKGYVIETTGNDINLNNFIGRISDNKYIVVGDLEAKIPGNNTNVKGDYFEIVYTEEGIINIENKDNKYQVTAEGTTIYVGNLAIDLGNKKIVSGDEDIMSLTAITINGNENIEIMPKEDKKDDGNGGEENPNDNNPQNPTDNQPGENEDGNGGAGGGNGDSTDEVKTEDIVVSLKDAEVGSTSVSLAFDFINQKADDTFTLKVTNLDTGRTVDIVNNILPDERININLLSPNTKYLFTVINEQDNNKYFQKIFETNGFGIKLEKAYATEDTLAYKVTVEEGTDITNAKLSLYKFNEETMQNEIVKTSYYDNVSGEVKSIEKVTNLSASTGNIEGVHEIVYDGLDSDTIYTAVLDEFSLVSSNFRDIYNITLTSMTLKKTPSFNDMVVSKDIAGGSFKLSLDDINDPDNAIVSYTYLIYENSNPNTTAIEPISKSNASPIEIKIGDKENQLKNDTNYFYRVVIEYFDNEKYIEYITTDSINFVMGTEPYITVVPDNTRISYDKIAATIYLIDNSCLISMPGREKCDADSTTIVDVSKINPITGERNTVFTKLVEFDVTEDEVKYDLFLDKLQAGTTYTIDVRAVRNDLPNSDRMEISHTEESRRNITTKSLASFTTEWNDEGSNANHVVNVESKLIAEDGSGTLSADETAASIKKVVARLYEGGYEEDLLTRQPIATKVFSNTEEFNIKEQFYDNGYVMTTDETFGLDIDMLKELNAEGNLSEYYTIALYAYYDNETVNEVRLSNNITSYRISPILLMDNIEDPLIFVDPITKANAGFENNLLNPGTYVGYTVTASIDRTGLLANHLEPKRINFYVYNEAGNRVNFYILNGNRLEQVDKITANMDENNSYISKIYMGYGTEYGTSDTAMTRGNKYYVGYEIEVDENGGIIKYPSNSNRTIDNSYGLYQSVDSEKETPTYTSFIAKSTANSVTYRYNVKDPDNALYKESDSDTYGFYYTVNDGEEHKLNLTRTNGEFKTFAGDMTIAGLESGDIYNLYFKKNGTKTGNFSEDVKNYYDADSERLFEGYYDSTDGKYNFKYEVINNPLVDNKVTIKILATDDILSRILSYRINFSDNKGNNLAKEIGNLIPCDDDTNRCYTVDYMELKEAGMKSENNQENMIRVSVQALYDNGLTGYDYTVGPGKDYRYMIFQNNNTKDEYGKYVTFVHGQLGNWGGELDVAPGYYIYSLMNTRISYNSEFNTSYNANINFTLKSNGYSSNFGILNPKMISISNMSSDSNTFSFNSITPKVAISNTTSIINGALVDLLLTGVDINDFCEEANGTNCVNTRNGDKYLYINVWDSQDDVGDNTKIARPTVKVKINNDNPTEAINAVIDKLNNGGTYYYNVYAYLNKNDRKVFTQLFDAGYSDRYAVKTYEFTALLSDDVFQKFEINVKPKTDGEYSDKIIETKVNLFAYNNNIPFNFDVSYAFCNIDDENCGTGTGNTNLFKHEVSMDDLGTSFADSVDVSDLDLEYNKNYLVHIYAIFDYYDKETDSVIKKTLLLNRRNAVVNLRALAMPEFVVSREAKYINNDYVIDFGINVKDTDRVLQSGKYFIKLTDINGNVVGNLQEKNGTDFVTIRTNGDYVDYELDATKINNNIRIGGLSANSKYTVTVYSTAYVNNYSETIPKVDRTFNIETSHPVFTTNSSGVAFGKDVTFTATEKSIVVTFLGGSSFNNVREVNYTIGLWGVESETTTFSGTYEISNNGKKFEYYTNTDDWRFVIDPEGMENQLGQTYTVALSFKVENPDTGTIDYYDSTTNPEFAGRVQYVKDNN